MNKITETFDRFNKLKVIIIGDVMVDAYLWGNVNRISPEAPVPIVAVKKREERLGGAANVALNIQALGAEPILVSCIGNDDKGEVFTNLLKDRDLSTKGIHKSKDRITTTKFRIIGNNSQLLRVDEEITSEISKEETDKLIEITKNILEKDKIDAIIFEDYDKGIISKQLIEEVIKLAKGKNIPVTVDPKKRHFLSYKNVSLFKPNLKELKEGLKIEFDHKNIKELEKAVTQLKSEVAAEIIMVTLSEQGVFISNAEKHHTISAHIRNIADVSGAGDTVISVATLCLAAGLNPEQIAAIANLAGGLVCEKVGVVSIDKEQLLKEVLLLGII